MISSAMSLGMAIPSMTLRISPLSSPILSRSSSSQKRQPIKQFVDRRRLPEDSLKGCSGNTKAIRHAYSFNPGELAQVRAFAANNHDHCLVNVMKTKHVGTHSISFFGPGLAPSSKRPDAQAIGHGADLHMLRMIPQVACRMWPGSRRQCYQSAQQSPQQSAQKSPHQSHHVVMTPHHLRPYPMVRSSERERHEAHHE